MRTRLLGLVLLGVLLTACGGDPAAEQGTDAASTAAPTPATPGATRDDLGAAFRAFARGRAGPPPMADQVDLYLGNAFTGFVTRDRAGHRGAWATCTETGSYAARSCPLSALTVLRDHPRVAYREELHGSCLATYGPLPPDLRALDRTTIVPASGSAGACARDFAVQLVSNTDGELVAVSLLLGER